MRHRFYLPEILLDHKYSRDRHRITYGEKKAEENSPMRVSILESMLALTSLLAAFGVVFWGIQILTR